MPVIRFAPQAHNHQVEPPKDCERSCKGAIHVRPGTTKVVTQAELEHLQALRVPLLVVQASPPSAKKPERASGGPQRVQAEGGASPVSVSLSDASEATGGDSGHDSNDKGGKGSKKASK